MKISSNYLLDSNFSGVNFNKINFTHQNPINFKGNHKQDSVDISDEAKAKALILKLKQENEQLLAEKDELMRIIEENQKAEVKNNDIDRQYRSLRDQLEAIEHKIKRNAQAICDLESSPKFILVYNKEPSKGSETEKTELLKQLDLILYLDDPQYDHIRPKAKRAIANTLENYGWSLLNNTPNREYLGNFNEFNVMEEKELIEDYGITAEELFGKCIKVKHRRDQYLSWKLILIPRNELTDKILSDIESKKVITQKKLKIRGLILPWTYEKYVSEDELSTLNYKFIKINDEKNQLLIYDAVFRRLVQTLPFNYNEIGLIDVNDEHNRKLLENAHGLYPTRSQYAFAWLGNSGNNKIINIPTKELEHLGFSKESLLIDLINNGKLDGVQDENGQYYVTINTANHLGKNKNLDYLNLLRKQDPRIRTFRELATRLSITQKRLEYAIFSGEVEIISKFINIADKEIRYINIATPKNQEFIRKIKFEQELEKQLKGSQRETRKQAKIENKDLSSRIQGVRMALVWNFMPNTKAVGSMLATSDGYFSQLIAKENDPNYTLSPKEETKLNSYRREIWIMAGTDELKMAHKKASAIMKTFKEQGLSAIDSEYLPIFERYGFILA